MDAISPRLVEVEIKGSRRIVKLCGLPGCDRVHRAHGRCQGHYVRDWKRERPRLVALALADQKANNARG